MLGLLNNTTVHHSVIIKNVRTSFETLDTRLLGALCDANTEGKMMSDKRRGNGSGEKNPG